MKSEYKKPTVRIEHFTMSQNIAAGCGAAHNSDWGGPSYWTKSTCGWRMPDGETIAWIEGTACNDYYGPDEEILGVCYNNPEGGYTIFSS